MKTSKEEMHLNVTVTVTEGSQPGEGGRIGESLVGWEFEPRTGAPREAPQGSFRSLCRPLALGDAADSLPRAHPPPLRAPSPVWLL